MAGEGSPTLTRILGVTAAALLAFGTFGALGLALATTLYDRGLVGRGGVEETGSLAYLLAGLAAGAAVGMVVAIWVGLRVWHSQWTLLLLLAALAAVTALTLAIAYAA